MINKKEKDVIDEMIGTELAQQMLSEMGIENEPQMEQAKLLGALGRTILERVLWETLKALPESDHAEFQKYFDAKDLVGMHAFLQPRIPEYSQFIQHHAQLEYESIKTRAHMVAQRA